MIINLSSEIKSIKHTKFYELSIEERQKKLEELFAEIDKNTICDPEEMLRELWKIRNKE